jgi:hypothetical protein
MDRNFSHYHVRDMTILGGWLFADLLLGLMVIFLAATPQTPLPAPPVLEVSPTSLSVDHPNCAGGKSTPRCTIVIGETASSKGSVHWQARSDMGSGIVFSPSEGTLSPGQSREIHISAFPCQNGSFTFTGSRNAMPVSVLWECTPLPERLEKESAGFKLNVSDVQGLLKDSPVVIADLEQQLRGEPKLKGRSVGLAIVAGGTPDVNSSSTAQQVAGKIYQIMRNLGKAGFVFQRSSYYTNLFKLGGEYRLSDVLVDVYRFCTNMEEDQCRIR